MNAKKNVKPPAAKVRPYASMAELWEHVCSGTSDYREFPQPYHERRFLQALHSDRALALMAKEISNDSRPVTVASAFIDARPRFQWKDGAGEIADLLVVVKRTDHKRHHELACLVQTKVSNTSNELGDGDSTEQQLALYRRWPKIAFKSEGDLAALREPDIFLQHEFILNPDMAVEWPFPFLRICNIATPTTCDQSIPSWATDGEPFAMMGSVPEHSPTTLMAWLRNAGTYAKPDAMEVIDGEDSNPVFCALVHSLLAVLASRKNDGKFGYSGGQLINECNLEFNFDRVQQFIPEHRTVLADKIGLFTYNDADEISPADDAFLIIYIEVGAESDPSQKVKSFPTRPYPGIDLLSSPAAGR